MVAAFIMAGMQATKRAFLKKAPLTLRDQFGKRLATTFFLAGITPKHYDALSQRLIQHAVGKRIAPYADFIIEGWINGELLPDERTFETLVAVLQQQYHCNSEALTSMQQAFEEARAWQETQNKRPTELTHAMQTARLRLEMHYASLEALVPSIYKSAADDSGKLPKAQGIHDVLAGRIDKNPGKELISKLAATLDPAIPQTGGLALLHESQLRERASLMWAHALQEVPVNFGMMIHACRIRRGESQKNFGRAFASLIGASVACDQPAIQAWESNKSLPFDKKKQSYEPMCEALVQLMQITDGVASAATGANQPWFDPIAQQQLRDAFWHNARQKYNLSYPSRRLTEPPSLQDVSDVAKEYQGSLAYILLRRTDRTDDKKPIGRAAQHEYIGEFSEQLRAACRYAEITTEADKQQWGKAVAQHQGERRPIPYAAITVDGWLKGDILPSPRAFVALCEVLNEQHAVGQGFLDALDERYEAALDWQQEQRIQPDELTHLLNTARRYAGLKFEDLQEKSRENGTQATAKKQNCLQQRVH